MGAKVKIHFMYATRTIKYISKRIKKSIKTNTVAGSSAEKNYELKSFTAYTSVCFRQDELGAFRRMYNTHKKAILYVL